MTNSPNDPFYIPPPQRKNKAPVLAAVLLSLILLGAAGWFIYSEGISIPGWSASHEAASRTQTQMATASRTVTPSPSTVTDTSATEPSAETITETTTFTETEIPSLLPEAAPGGPLIGKVHPAQPWFEPLHLAGGPPEAHSCGIRETNAVFAGNQSTSCFFARRTAMLFSKALREGTLGPNSEGLTAGSLSVPGDLAGQGLIAMTCQESSGGTSTCSSRGQSFLVFIEKAPDSHIIDLP